MKGRAIFLKLRDAKLNEDVSIDRKADLEEKLQGISKDNQNIRKC